MSYLINGPIDIKDNSNTNQAKINLYNPAGTFYVSLISPPSLSSSFNFSFPTTPGVTGQYLSSTGTGETNWRNAVTTSYSLPICGTTYPGLTGNTNTALILQTTFTSLSFYNLAYTVFPGLNSLGGSTSWSFYISANASGTSFFQAKILDITNGTTIINSYTSSAVTATQQLFNLGPMSNLSANAAIWQILLRFSSGTAGIRIFSYQMFG